MRWQTTGRARGASASLPDGRASSRWAVGASGRLDLDTGAPLAEDMLPAAEALRLAVTADGQRAVTVSDAQAHSDRHAHLWDVASGACCASFAASELAARPTARRSRSTLPVTVLDPHRGDARAVAQGPVGALAVSPDGATVVTVTSVDDYRGRTITQRAADTGVERSTATYHGRSTAIDALALARRSQRRHHGDRRGRRPPAAPRRPHRPDAARGPPAPPRLPVLRARRPSRSRAATPRGGSSSGTSARPRRAPPSSSAGRSARSRSRPAGAVLAATDGPAITVLAVADGAVVARLEPGDSEARAGLRGRRAALRRARRHDPRRFTRARCPRAHAVVARVAHAAHVCARRTTNIRRVPLARPPDGPRRGTHGRATGGLSPGVHGGGASTTLPRRAGASPPPTRARHASAAWASHRARRRSSPPAPAGPGAPRLPRRDQRAPGPRTQPSTAFSREGLSAAVRRRAWSAGRAPGAAPAIRRSGRVAARPASPAAPREVTTGRGARSSRASEAKARTEPASSVAIAARSSPAEASAGARRERRPRRPARPGTGAGSGTPPARPRRLSRGASGEPRSASRTGGARAAGQWTPQASSDTAPSSGERRITRIARVAGEGVHPSTGSVQSPTAVGRGSAPQPAARRARDGRAEPPGG